MQKDIAAKSNQRTIVNLPDVQPSNFPIINQSSVGTGGKVPMHN